jgi:hypothetical protein
MLLLWTPTHMGRAGTATMPAGFCVRIYADASTAFMLRLAALAGCNELVRNPRLTDEGYVDSH